LSCGWLGGKVCPNLTAVCLPPLRKTILRESDCLPENESPLVRLLVIYSGKKPVEHYFCSIIEANKSLGLWSEPQVVWINAYRIRN